MIEITTSNSTKVNELLFAFGNLRDEVMVITMTTPTLTPFHQKNSRVSASRSASAPCIALPESPKLRAKQGHAKSATLTAKLPSHPASGRVPQPRDSHIQTLRSSARFTETERSRAAFTLIELLAVITVIGILAGLTLGAAGAVRRHGATSTAKAEVAALQAACDRYYADYNSYPTTTNSMPDPSSGYSPSASTYTTAGQVLFTNLFGGNQYNVAPSAKRYFEPKPSMVNSTNTANPYLIDPWGYAYGYNSDGTNAPLIWSTAGQTTGGANTNKWITSWPKM
jgi:prepilin-type N-terminal cleavage/methylation domain-containing protein